MKGGPKPLGFTLVETLIVLAVTGAMFLMAMLIINGKQQQTQFTQSIRDFESSLQDLANNVTTGYYNYPADTKCVAGPAAVSEVDISHNPIAGESEQGNSTNCIFIGQVIQFAPHGKSDGTYIVYPIAGKKSLGTPPKDIDNLIDSKPTAIATSTVYPYPPGSDVDATSEIEISGGSSIKWVRANGTTDVGSIGFFTTFGRTSVSTGQLESGSTLVDLYTLDNAIDSSTKDAFVKLIHDDVDSGSNWSSTINPVDGVTICIEGGIKQHAKITIGGNGGQFGIYSVLGDGSCS